uniref:Small ribosomal subunit protein uS3m n=1 Tax=Lobosphaera incisa TaxID=312850 RepID=A0A0F7BIH8_9CHLO|nr:ribosomal protein S3 [Lobosphaera incisa]AKF78675.1 ribosomal protein S3 [Lobosphaera incisa]
MGQKVNPVSLRLEKTNKHFDCCWYSDYNYTNLIVQDLKIQNYISSVLKQIKYPEPHFLIKNLPFKISINFFFCNPINSRKIRLSKFRLPPEKTEKVKEYKKNRNLFGGLPQTTSSQRFFPLIGSESTPLKTMQSTSLCGALLKQQMEEPFFLPKKLSPINEKKKGFLTTNKKNTFLHTSHTFLKSIVCSPPKKSPATNHKKLADKITAYIYSMGVFDHSTLHLKINPAFSEIDKVPPIPFVNNGENDLFFYVKNINQRLSPVRTQTGVQILIRHWILFVYFSLKQNLLVEKQNIMANTQLLQIYDREQKWGNPVFSSSKNCVISNNPLSPLPQYVISPFRDHMESIISNQLKLGVNLTSLRNLDDTQSSLFLVEEIVNYLQRRVSFRTIKNQIMKEVLKSKNIRGIRIAFSGRLGGRSKKAQRSKTEYLRWGQTSLHVFSSQISFAHKAASTRFGLLGVKVWICFKEIPPISTLPEKQIKGSLKQTT